MALSIIYQMEITGDWSAADKINSIEKQSKEDKYISDYAIKIIEHVVKDKEKIDKLITKFSNNWSFDRISVIDKSVLRLGIAELLMYTPKTAVINEALEITDKYGEKDSKPFINGLLDTISCNLE